MPDETKRNQLYIVPKQKRMPISALDFVEPGTQGMLFPAPKHGLILFVLFPDVTEQEFRDVLKSAMPSYVIELRASPRFDIGNLTRQAAFQAFQHHNINYLDLTSALMKTSDIDAVLYRLRDFLREMRPKFDRPMIFLVNRAESNETLVPRVMEALTEFSAEPKHILEVPHFVDESRTGPRIAVL